MSDPNELLTVAEVADILRRSEETLRYWRHIGTGPLSFKVGRRTVYLRSDLDAFIAKQHAETSRGAA